MPCSYEKEQTGNGDVAASLTGRRGRSQTESTGWVAPFLQNPENTSLSAVTEADPRLLARKGVGGAGALSPGGDGMGGRTVPAGEVSQVYACMRQLFNCILKYVVYYM